MRLIIFGLLLSTATMVNGQVYNPVGWDTTVKNVGDDYYDLIITATIAGGWRLYSQTVPEDGPLPTLFVYEENGIDLLGGTKEEIGETANDPFFGLTIKYFSNYTTFVQRVKAKVGTTVYAEVGYMVSDGSKYLPPMIENLKFILK